MNSKNMTLLYYNSEKISKGKHFADETFKWPNQLVWHAVISTFMGPVWLSNTVKFMNAFSRRVSHYTIFCE